MNLGRQPLLIGGCCLVVIVAGLATWMIKRNDCRSDDEVVPAAEVSAPFTRTPADARTTTLAKEAADWGIGEVIGTYGFDYDQQMTVAAVGGSDPAVLTWVKRDPVMAVLADTGTDLKPIWGLKQQEVRRTWDASATSFVTVTAPESGPQLTSYALADGERQWCRRLDHDNLLTADSIATSGLSDGSVVAATGDLTVDVSRLAGSDGATQWARTVKVRRGDSLVASGDVLVLGSASPRPEGASTASGEEVTTVVGLDADDGSTIWTHDPAPGVWTQVVGQDDKRTILLEQGGGKAELVALTTSTGEEGWRVRVPVSASPDATVRDGVVIDRSPTKLAGYDITTGDMLWKRKVPQVPQYFPYGFTLGGSPYVDGGVLLGGTEALHLLNPKRGTVRDLPLPTDGVNTTWWPYQVVAGAHSTTVVTNTGAVVIGRA